MSAITLVSLCLAVLVVNRHQNLPDSLSNGFVFISSLTSSLPTIFGEDVTLQSASTTFETPTLFCRTASCRQRCGQIATPYQRNPCSCDMDCIVYQDCCLDFVSICIGTNGTDTLLNPHPGQVNPPPSGTPKMSCVYHNRFFFNPAYMVTGCPKSYEFLAIRDQCENDNVDSVINNLPVFVYDSFLYRNVYCALCNSVNISRVNTYDSNLFCPFSELMSKEYLEKRPLAKLTFSEILEMGCQILLKKERRYNSRQCPVVDLDTCQKPGPIKDACEAYLDPVSITFADSLTLPYAARNKYCKQCNEREEFVAFRCWQGRPSGPDNFGPGFRFSVLFDFTDIYHTDDETSEDVFESDQAAFSEYFLNGHLTMRDDETVDNLPEGSDVLTMEEVVMTRCFTNNSQHIKTAYHVNATFSSDSSSLLSLVELFSNFASEQTGLGRNVSGSVRNTENCLEDVCLAPPRFYDINIFFQRSRLLSEDINVTGGNSTPRIPFEIFWLDGQTDSCLSDCYGYKRWYNGHQLVSPAVAVCGDTLEPSCDTNTYLIDELLNRTGNEGLSEFKETRVFQTDKQIGTCGAIIWDDGRDPRNDRIEVAEYYITVVGCSLSILGLIVTFIIYCIFEPLRNVAGQCVLNLVCALLVAHVLFVVGSLVAGRNEHVCYAVSILQHYFWLGTFSWTNVIAFDLAYTLYPDTAFPMANSGSKRLAQYLIVAWGLPLIIVSITATLDFTSLVTVSYGQYDICWIGNNDALLASFVAPITVCLIFNSVAFGFVVYHIRKIVKMTESMSVVSKHRNELGVYTRITVVLGFTWVIGYLTNIWPGAALRIVFAGVNSLRGFLISLTFLFTSRVMRLCRNRFGSESPEEFVRTRNISKLTTVSQKYQHTTKED